MRCYQYKDGRWRWIFFDGDDALYDLDYDVFDYATSLLDLDWPTNSQSTLMFRKLLENEEFAGRFVRRFSELLVTTFSYRETKPFFDDAVALVSNEVPEQSTRFGLPQSPKKWKSDLRVVRDFLQQREANIGHRIDDFFAIEDNKLIVSDLFPNPSIDEIHLLVWSEEFTLCRLEVFDMMGRTVLTSKVVLKTGENDLQFSCHFASGLYLLRLGNQTKRLLIQ